MYLLTGPKHPADWLADWTNPRRLVNCLETDPSDNTARNNSCIDAIFGCVRVTWLPNSPQRYTFYTFTSLSSLSHFFIKFLFGITYDGRIFLRNVCNTERDNTTEQLWSVFQKNVCVCYCVVLRNLLHLKATNYPSFNIIRMQIRLFVRNSVRKCVIDYKTMRVFWTPLFSVIRASFMTVVRLISTTAGSGSAKIHLSPWNMFVGSQRWTCFAPLANKECTGPSSCRRPLPLSCIWTASNSSSFHS
jgi:hypothetical protein